MAQLVKIYSNTTDQSMYIILYRYGLLTKCEVKMAGYWPSSFFACLWTETKSRSINSQKKNEAGLVVFMLLFFLYPIYFFNTLIAVLK